jgi:hypothetical protein
VWCLSVSVWECLSVVSECRVSVSELELELALVQRLILAQQPAGQDLIIYLYLDLYLYLYLYI